MANPEIDLGRGLVQFSSIGVPAGMVGVQDWPSLDSLVIGPDRQLNTLAVERPRSRPTVRKAGLLRSRRQSCDCYGKQPHVVSEHLFRDALMREHRRAERFDHVFVVLFVRVNHQTPSTLALVIRSVGAAVSDDAIVGWSHKGEELGIILADLGLSAPSAARETELRIWQVLAREVGVNAPDSVSIRVDLHDGVNPQDAANASPPHHVRSDLRSGLWLDGSKRALDIAGSLLLLVVLSPLFLLIAGLIKAMSPGPILFRQVRLGRGAKSFTMLKFRTMEANADSTLHKRYVQSFINSMPRKDAGDGKVFKMLDDPRITRIGRTLRRTSLDELPQFWNVLKGDMSLVGPRPPLQYELEQYRTWHWRRVREAKPGVTGLWQVKGRSRTTFDEMVRLDLQYVQNRSLRMDLQILLATPLAVFTGKGAC